MSLLCLAGFSCSQPHCLGHDIMPFQHQTHSQEGCLFFLSYLNRTLPMEYEVRKCPKHHLPVEIFQRRDASSFSVSLSQQKTFLFQRSTDKIRQTPQNPSIQRSTQNMILISVQDPVDACSNIMSAFNSLVEYSNGPKEGLLHFLQNNSIMRLSSVQCEMT